MVYEVWKPVVGYEGFYEVSNLGRIRSLPRATTKGVVLSAYKNKRNGYAYVSLSKENCRKSVRVHKVVIEAFTNERFGSYDKLKTVNHINGDKLDNRLDNLEVCTQSENQNHAYRIGLQVRKGTTVVRLEDKQAFTSFNAAARSVGGKLGNLVRRVCNGERSHYRGWHFCTLEDYVNNTIPKYRGKVTRKESKTLWR